MLEAAMGISSLVQEQNVVKWTQTDMVANYVRRLQAAVQRLAVLNQQLSQCHDQIREKVNAFAITSVVKEWSSITSIQDRIRAL